MANEVLIKIRAVDLASASFKKINVEIEKTGTTAQQMGRKLSTAFNTFTSSPKMMIGAVTAVGGALAGFGATVKGLADDFQNYAFQVKDFGRIIGATPEEASKLIQVADDVRLSVGSMTTAMRAAITKGYEPSIEGLGKLADEYNAIADPIEKSRFLIERFGRSGLEMAKLLELGSTQIQQMGDSIEGTGLLMTQSGVDAATEYYQAIDTLGDSWTSLTMILGRQAIPVLTDAVDALNNFVTDTQKAASAANDLETAVALGLIPIEEYQKAMDALSIKDATYYNILKNQAVPVMEEYRKKYQDILPDMAEMIRKTTLLGDESETTAQDLADMALNIDKSAVYAGNLADKAGAAARKVKELGDAANVMIEVGFEWKMPDLSGMIQNAFNLQEWEAAGGLALEAALGKVGAAVASGAITKPQANTFFREIFVEAERIKVEMGNITADEAAANISATLGVSLAEALAMVKEIKRQAQFDIESTLTIAVYYNKYGVTAGVNPNKTKMGGEEKAEQLLNPPEPPKPPKVPKGPGGANGLNMIVPAGYPNDTFPIRATSGEQVTITKPGQSAGGNVYFGDVIINAAQGQSATQIANQVVSQINRSMRSSRRSGLGYTG